MADKIHPFTKLSNLVRLYEENKDSFDAEKLQSMREDISITLFNLSDSCSSAIANFDAADYERKRSFAQLIEDNKWDKDGNKNTVAVTESLARIANEKKELAAVEALRQKERVKIIISSTQQILHSISSRLNIIK